MSEVTIYHNPRCTKSRQTFQLLQEKGVEPTVVEYINNPLSSKDISGLLEKLSMSPSDLIRRKEALFKELELKDAAEDTLLQAMVEHPKLIERPIVVKGAKAAIGRPPENVLAIL